MLDVIIGMATGTVFIAYVFFIPLLALLYLIAGAWVENVTNKEHKLSDEPLKRIGDYYSEFLAGVIGAGYLLFGIFGTLIYFIPRNDGFSFFDDYTYLEFCIKIFYEMPSKAGAWASDVILIISVYYLSTWAAKWVYSLASRINKLEEKEEDNKT